jgi:threonine dehydrogenase-like Zn-dependent dehydrogenase
MPGPASLAFGTYALTALHGAYAGRTTVPAEILVPIPDAVDDDQVAMAEPATVALHAVRRRPPRLAETVVGLGPAAVPGVERHITPSMTTP